MSPDMQALLVEIKVAIESATNWTAGREKRGPVEFDALEAVANGWRFLLCAAPATDGWPPIGTATHAEKFVVVNLPRDLVEFGVKKARGGA